MILFHLILINISGLLQCGG